MRTATAIDIPGEYRGEPDISECHGRTVEASARTVEAAVARLDLIGPLVDGLIAIGVGDHIVTPCANGLVWRFDRAHAGQIRLSWAVTVEPETDEAALVRLSVRARATDVASRERLFEAWPVLGPVVELHARRVLHAIEALAEAAAEDPSEGWEPASAVLRAVG